MRLPSTFLLVALVNFGGCEQAERLPERCALHERFAAADTADWRPAPNATNWTVPPLLPPGYEQDTTVTYSHGGEDWVGPDGTRIEFLGGIWDEGSFGSAEDAASEGLQFMSCWASVGGVPAYHKATWSDSTYRGVVWVDHPDDGSLIEDAVIVTGTGPEAIGVLLSLMSHLAHRFKDA